ncbi:adenylate cyclase type 3 [Platysternon megacephalum]|uniref:Adenylate cyclase type 3 n=1 Tax=Platysternon megacephalum TaxID=55544 RepID=A0A4D9E7W4_9SAUR|nr:adenylate cyclase type 3 [Platysternon megacephalum]
MEIQVLTVKCAGSSINKPRGSATRQRSWFPAWGWRHQRLGEAWFATIQLSPSFCTAEFQPGRPQTVHTSAHKPLECNRLAGEGQCREAQQRGGERDLGKGSGEGRLLSLASKQRSAGSSHSDLPRTHVSVLQRFGEATWMQRSKPNALCNQPPGRLPQTH